MTRNKDCTHYLVAVAKSALPESLHNWARYLSHNAQLGNGATRVHVQRALRCPSHCRDIHPVLPSAVISLVQAESADRSHNSAHCTPQLYTVQHSKYNIEGAHRVQY